LSSIDSEISDRLETYSNNHLEFVETIRYILGANGFYIWKIIVK